MKLFCCFVFWLGFAKLCWPLACMCWAVWVYSLIHQPIYRRYPR
jgi:hypothetical protein